MCSVFHAVLEVIGLMLWIDPVNLVVESVIVRLYFEIRRRLVLRSTWRLKEEPFYALWMAANVKHCLNCAT